MDKVKEDSRNFSARGKGVIWDDEVQMVGEDQRREFHHEPALFDSIK